MSRNALGREPETVTDEGLVKNAETGEVRGFAVVVERVVGTVEFGNGTKSPHSAAMTIIGDTGEEGRFSFPNENGGRTTVEVTFPLRDNDNERDW
jgi:hypothetical protein